MNLKPYLLFGFAALTLCGCATTNSISSSPQFKAYLSEYDKQLKAKPIGIITTACALKSEVTNTFIDKKTSASIAAADAVSSTAYFSSINYQPKTLQNSLICPFLDTSNTKIKMYDETTDEKKLPDGYPIYIKDAPKFDAEKSLLKLFKATDAANSTVATRKIAEFTPVSIDIDDNDVQQLKNLFGASYVYMSFNNDVKNSFGKKFVHGTISAAVVLATAGAGAGTVSFIMPADGASKVMYIVDLDKKQFVYGAGGFKIEDSMAQLTNANVSVTPSTIPPAKEDNSK